MTPPKQPVYTIPMYCAFEHRAGGWHAVYYPSPPQDAKVKVWPVRIPVPAELVGELLTAKHGA